ncbi:MAG TPA: hypothetical protein PLX35_17335, partial [Cyclobacteriaceae bacterium]|nr:hypothetical protein [Cyclobacteriaceae bacterium]
MKTNLFTLLLLTILVHMLHAQDSTRAIKKYIEAEFNAGYVHSDFQALNSFLRQNGMNPLGPNRYTVGVAAQWADRPEQRTRGRNRWVYGMYLNVTIPQSDEQPNQRKSRFVGYHIGWMQGYTLAQSRDFRLDLFLRLSYYSNYNVQIIDTGSQPNLSTAITTPHQNITLGTSTFLGSSELGLSASRFFPVTNRSLDNPVSDTYVIV